MTTRTAFDLYKRQRRQDRRMPASTALALARQAERVPAGWWPGDEPETWCAEGWTYTARLRWDECPIPDWLGEFTDDDGPDTIPNPEYQHGRYKRFRPANPGMAEFPYYRAAGMGKAEARERCAELDRDAARRAAAGEMYGVTVEATGPNGETGEASLGGIDDEHPYGYAWSVAVDELAPEARGEAEASALRRFAALCRVPVAIVEGVPA